MPLHYDAGGWLGCKDSYRLKAREADSKGLHLRPVLFLCTAGTGYRESNRFNPETMLRPNYPIHIYNIVLYNTDLRSVRGSAPSSAIYSTITWERYASQLRTRTSARNFFFGEAETVAPFPIHFSYASDTHETPQQKLYKRQADKDWYRLPPLHTAVQRSSATGGGMSFVASNNTRRSGKHPPDR